LDGGADEEEVVADKRRGDGRPRLPTLELTEPEIVPITPKQYRQAVDLLAAMIADYAAAHAMDERPKTAGDAPVVDD
jgi:hypothetical protein